MSPKESVLKTFKELLEQWESIHHINTIHHEYHQKSIANIKKLIAQLEESVAKEKNGVE